MNLRLYLYLLPVLLLSLAARGGELLIEKYPLAAGLPNSFVSCITQDSRGFIWIGTDWGLVRYDGRVMKKYVNMGPNGFSDLSISSISEDREGKLWIGTGNRIARLDPFTDSITKYVDLPGAAYQVYVDRKGTAWTGSARGLFRLNADGKTFKHFDLAMHGADVRINAGVFNFFEDSRNRFWIATSYGVYLFDRKTDTWQHYHFPDAGKRHNANNSTQHLFEDREGTIWAGSWGGGLLRFLPSEQRFESISIYEQGVTGPDLLNVIHDIDSITVHGRRYLILATERGLVLAEPQSIEGGRLLVSKFIRMGEGPYHLLSDVVLTIDHDRQGNYWVGTQNGLHKIDPLAQSVSWIPTVWPGILTKEKVFRIWNDAPAVDGRLLIAAANNWLSYDPATEEMSVHKLPAQNGEMLYFVNRHISTDTGVWFTSEKGFGFYDIAHNRCIDHSIPGLTDSRTGAIEADRYGRIWYSSFRSGVRIYDPHTKKTISLFSDPADSNNIIGQNLFDFQEDGKGNMLITVAKKMLRVNLNDLSYTSVYPPDDPHRSERAYPRKILKTASGRFILQSPLKFYEYRNDSIVQIYPASGSTGFMMYQLQQDKSGALLVVANNGLYTVDEHFKKWIDLTGKLAVDNPEDFYEMTMKDGKVMIACPGRFCMFRLQDLISNKAAPVPVISRLKTGRRESYMVSFSKQAWNISFKESIEFELSAINFSHEQGNRIYYRLEGWDADWKELEGNPVVRYEQLPPGDYVFEVKAANEDGVMSVQPTTLSFIVTPPFWRTWWFLALAVLLVAAIAYSVYRYRINQLIKEERMRARIATDLHDDIGATLSSISFYSEAIRQQTAQKMPNLTPMLEKMGETSRDMVSNMSDIVWAINPGNDSFEQMLNRMHSHAAELCDVRGVLLDFQYDKKMPALQLGMEQRRNIYLIFKEALNNALKYAEAVRIFISVAWSGGVLQLTVRDDGNGFGTKTVAEHGGGNGLNNMKLRAEEINGICTIETSQSGTIVRLECKIT